MNIIDGRFDNSINLAICIFPSDILSNAELSVKMTEYTKFYALRFNQILQKESKLDVHYATSIDNGLLELSDNYDHILFMASGVRIFNMDIIFDIEQMILDNPNYFAAAHILDWKERWFELHHQFVLVNTKQWNICNQPKYGNWDDVTEELPVIERSVENFHDDYTPLWIKFTGEYSQQRHQVQGWNFINAACRNNLEILNWPQNIRLKRTYYYPESNSEEFLNSLKNLTLTDIKNPNQRRLIEQCISTKNQIWVINSEYMKLDSKDYEKNTYDTVVTTASGFKFLDAYKSNLLFDGICRHCNESSKLIIYDFNPLSLEWIKYLYDSTEEDIGQLVQSFKYKENFKILGGDVFSSTGALTKNFHDGLLITKEYFEGHGKFIETLRTFRKSRVEFIKADLFNDHSELVNSFGGKTLFNISNIFCTDVGNAYYGMSETKQRYQKLLDSITVECTVVGHDADCNQIRVTINKK